MRQKLFFLFLLMLLFLQPPQGGLLDLHSCAATDHHDQLQHQQHTSSGDENNCHSGHSMAALGGCLVGDIAGKGLLNVLLSLSHYHFYQVLELPPPKLA
ncbi:hypothetical protein ACFVYJ_11255 [Pontibacter sp. JAM-7]|uniref:hypothetical protein n=1 Tax=Pontibacter sp. JAM-7 TaxID=3366581 RepID=UPI003AF5AA79